MPSTDTRVAALRRGSVRFPRLELSVITTNENLEPTGRRATDMLQIGEHPHKQAQIRIICLPSRRSYHYAVTEGMSSDNFIDYIIQLTYDREVGPIMTEMWESHPAYLTPWR